MKSAKRTGREGHKKGAPPPHSRPYLRTRTRTSVGNGPRSIIHFFVLAKSRKERLLTYCVFTPMSFSTPGRIDKETPKDSCTCAKFIGGTSLSHNIAAVFVFMWEEKVKSKNALLLQNNKNAFTVSFFLFSTWWHHKSHSLSCPPRDIME